MDLRNANGGRSSGLLEIDRPWHAYADDQLGLSEQVQDKRHAPPPEELAKEARRKRKRGRDRRRGTWNDRRERA